MLRHRSLKRMAFVGDFNAFSHREGRAHSERVAEKESVTSDNECQRDMTTL